MRYALDGATGFVGRALTRLLVQSGHQTSALVRDPARAAELEALGARLVVGDLDDRGALRDLVDGADGYFHVAGWYKLGDRHPGTGYQVNVEGTRNALTTAFEVGVPRVVHTSSLAVNSDTHGEVVDETYRFEGEHLSVYDRTKAQAHQVAHELADRGAPVVVVMPGLVYGPGDTSQVGGLLGDVIAGRRVVAPGAGGMCWAHVDDVAAGHLAAMERGRPGRDYMLAGPTASVLTAARLAASIVDGPQPLPVPGFVVQGLGVLSGLVGRVAPVPPLYAAESLRAARATYYGTPARAQAELGWTPRNLAEGLAATVAAA